MFIVWEHGSWALEAFEEGDGLDVRGGGVVRSCAVVAWGLKGGGSTSWQQGKRSSQQRDVRLSC